MISDLNQIKEFLNMKKTEVVVFKDSKHLKVETGFTHVSLQLYSAQRHLDKVYNRTQVRYT